MHVRSPRYFSGSFCPGSFSSETPTCFSCTRRRRLFWDVRELQKEKGMHKSNLRRFFFAFLFVLAFVTWLAGAGFTRAARRYQQRDATSVFPTVLEPVVTGLTSPVFVTCAHDGTNRLFIVEQGGIIKVLQPGS